MGTPLGTAHWAPPDFVEKKYAYADGTFWLGRSASEHDAPIGYVDDRHICLVSGTRGGKGTSSIITNLCQWPGSLVVVDPKGENATVTAARRGKGAQHCEGMGQRVHVLDPFRETKLDDQYRARFNPLDALHPKDPETIEKAALLADSIVIVNESTNPEAAFWDRHARQMVKALILHIVTAPEYEGRRNLVTLRKLILSGDQEAVEALRSMGEKEEPAHEMLWGAVIQNEAFGGRVSAMGSDFADMLVNSPKTYEGVRAVANGNTEFMDSVKMEDLVTASDFRLSDLKTDPKGVSVYLSLPQRYMNTHNRWLRMMVGLMIMEMETVSAQPACGHPVLVVLDEFAGMKRMESIETGVAQMAGYGVKLFFVLQSLEQLKAVYKDRWETFLTNCGLKLFFNIDDNFSREYVSKLMGETEVMREVRSEGANSSESDSLSASESDSSSESFGHSRSGSDTASQTYGRSVTEGGSHSVGRSETHGKTKSDSFTHGGSYSHTSGSSWSPQGFSFSSSTTTGSSGSYTHGTSESESVSRSVTDGTSWSASASVTQGASHTDGTGESETYGATHGTTHGTTHGVTRGQTSGIAETVHKRPLCAPDEIGKLFSRIDERGRRAYPGLGLAVVAGQAPVVFRRVNYYEDLQFIGLFSAHPDHKFLPPKKCSVSTDGLRKYSRYFSGGLVWWRGGELGGVVKAGDVIGYADPTPAAPLISLRSPRAGKIVKQPERVDPETSPADRRSMPPALTRIRWEGSVDILHYEDGTPAIDPFAELEARCRAFEDEKARQARLTAQERADAAQAQAAENERRKTLKLRDLHDSMMGWLKAAGAGGLLLAVDAALGAFTHLLGAHVMGGILFGLGAGVATGFCGYKAAGKFLEEEDVRNPKKPAAPKEDAPNLPSTEEFLNYLRNAKPGELRKLNYAETLESAKQAMRKNPPPE